MKQPESAPTPYRVLQNRDLLFYLIARNLVRIGSQLTSVAVGWELYRQTHNTMALAYVGLVQFVPALLLAIPAGHAADRYGRRRIVQSCQTVVVLCSVALALVFANRANPQWVYLWLLVAASARGFSGPATSALLRQYAPRDELESAIRWNSSVMQIGAMAGPALAGAVIAVTHSGTPAFVLDAVLGATGVVLLGIARPREAEPERSTAPMSIESLTAGLRFVWSSRIILGTISLDLFAVLFGGATALLPVYAADILKVDASGLGLLQAAPSFGALIMATLLAHMPPFRRPGVAMLWAVAGFGVATIVFGLSRSYLLSFAMLFLTGALDNVSVVVRSTLIQTLTPNQMMGRVSAVNQVFISSSNQLGGFESGLVASLTNPVFSVVFGGLGTLVVVLAVALGWPEVRRHRGSSPENL